MGLAPSTFTIRFVKDRYKMFGPESSKHDIRWRKPPSKGRIEKGEVNGKERKERHPRRGKGDIKERIAKEKGREGERERDRI